MVLQTWLRSSMSTCEHCGTENPKNKNFCKNCGKVIPVSQGTPIKGTAEDFEKFSSATAGIFNAFSKRKEQTAEPGAPAQQPRSGAENERSSTRGAASERSKGEVLRTVAKAGVKALTRSIALSIAVLGPGFVMLMMGMTVLGMVWLFAGSFSLMAWTYRKPWRLGLISCLLPPAAAGVCYLVQFALFGSVAPPALLVLGAVGMGIGVGFWRAQTHEVKAGEDGGIVAERTIHYLLVWVAAYAVTQVLGILALGTFAVRAGLVTGAFSTAMLAMVSLIIWRRYRTLAGQVAAVLLFAFAGLASPTSEAAAQGSPCATLFPQSDRNHLRLQRGCSTYFQKGIRDPELLRILTYETSGLSNANQLLDQADRLVSSGGTSNLLRAFDTYAQAYRQEIPGHLLRRKYIIGKMINLASKDRSPEMLGRIESIAPEYNALVAQICSVQSQGYAGISKFAREKRNADSCLAQAQAAMGRSERSQPSADSRTKSRPGADTPLCWSTISDGYIGPRPDLSENDPTCLFTMTCRRAMEIDGQGGKVEFQDKRYRSKSVGYIEPGDCSAIMNASQLAPSAAATPSATEPTGAGHRIAPPAGSETLIEDSAAAAAAVATVLIAAGVAVNVAQAIAAAIASALQAGVQLTSEEIQRAVSEALLANLPGRGNQEGGEADAADTTAPPARPPDSNAPPNVRLTERFRPPSPIYDENGNPFETNDDGQYWAPDENGNWRWLNKSEAQEASAALKGERAAREAEIDQHNRKTEEDLERSRQKMQANDEETRKREEREREQSEAWLHGKGGASGTREHEDWLREKENRDRREETERQADKAGIDPDEERRKSDLETGILNTIHNMEPGDDADDLMNRLIGAHERGSRRELEQLWEQVRGERQNQLDAAEKEAVRLRAESDKAQTRETIVTLARDGSKILTSAGLTAATGGSYTAVQAIGAGIIGTGTLVTTGAIEQGHKVENGEVTFDSWEATKGAVRGTVDAAGAMVGGVTANGNKVVMAGKTVFAGTSSYGRTFADTYEKTGDRDLAHGRATMAGLTEAAKTAGGEYFDERARQSQQNAADMLKNEPSGWNSSDNGTWQDNVDGILASEQTRINGAKTATNLLGGTLTNIATSDQDLTTAQATRQAAKSEAGGFAAGKIVGAADHGGSNPATENETPVSGQSSNARQDASRQSADGDDVSSQPSDRASSESRGRRNGDHQDPPSNGDPVSGQENRVVQESGEPSVARSETIADDQGTTAREPRVAADGEQYLDTSRSPGTRPVPENGNQSGATSRPADGEVDSHPSNAGNSLEGELGADGTDGQGHNLGQQNATGQYDMDADAAAVLEGDLYSDWRASEYDPAPPDGPPPMEPILQAGRMDCTDGCARIALIDLKKLPPENQVEMNNQVNGVFDAKKTGDGGGISSGNVESFLQETGLHPQKVTDMYPESFIDPVQTLKTHFKTHPESRVVLNIHGRDSRHAVVLRGFDKVGRMIISDPANPNGLVVPGRAVMSGSSNVLAKHVPEGRLAVDFGSSFIVSTKPIPTPKD